MKRLITAIAAALILMPQTLGAWSRTGHDAVCAIAEANLNPETKAIIEKYLDGNSFIRYSTWMDDVRRLPEYAYTSKCHVFAVSKKLKPLAGSNFKDGAYEEDALCELGKRIEMARNYKALDDSTVAVTIKMIVHLVGDIHCPGHVKYPGVKSPKVVFIDRKNVKFHTVWDSELIDYCHKWGFLEYAHIFNRLSPEQVEKITAGEPFDWCCETAKDCRFIYDALPEGEMPEIDKDLAFHTFLPLADSQIQKAGYRLAKLLNELFR